MTTRSPNIPNIIELPGLCPIFQYEESTISQSGTFSISLLDVSLSDLRTLCKHFNLKSSGTKKQDLKDTLAHFSSETALWTTAEHSPNRSGRKPHKGPRGDILGSTNKKRKQLLSRIRAKQLQENLIAPAGVERSHEARSLKQWAEEFVRRIKEGVPAKSVAGCKGLPTNKIIHRSISEIRAYNANRSTNLVISPTNSTPTANRDSLALDLPEIPTSSAIPGRSFNIAPYEIKLAGGKIFFFTDDDFVDFPVGTGVASNLDRLISMWDDDSPHWKNQSLLTIKSTPIAIKYWREIYGKFKRGSLAWNHGKSFWHRWKMLVEEYSSTSPQNFWEKFQVKHSGERLCISKVMENLARQRSKRSNNILTEAWKISKEDFAMYFSYIKNGAPVAMTNSHGIRKRYEKYQAERPQWFLKYINN